MFEISDVMFEVHSLSFLNILAKQLNREALGRLKHCKALT